MPSIVESHHAVQQGIEWIKERGLQPVVNFTGGTKLMSIGSFYAAVQTNTPSLYVDGNRQTFVDGNSAPNLASLLSNGLELGALGSFISLRMVLAAHGCAAENASRQIRDLVTPATALLLNPADEIRTFESVAGKNGAFATLRNSKNVVRWREAGQILFDLPETIGTPAEAAGLVRRSGQRFCLCPDVSHSHEKNHQSKRYRGPDPGKILQRRYQFFEGGWWEIVVANAVATCPLFADVNVNLTVAKGTQLSMEEDVLAIQGIQLAYISCKRGGADKLVRHLEELDASARRLGGKLTRKYLAVCHLPEHMRAGLRERARQLHVTLLEPSEISNPMAFQNAVSV